MGIVTHTIFPSVQFSAKLDHYKMKHSFVNVFGLVFLGLIALMGCEYIICTLIDKSNIGLTTPHGYTIMIDSDDSSTRGKLKADIVADRDFVANFTFDPEERSCYRIYTPDQDISPYTCLDESNISMACVHTWKKNNNCLVVTTEKDETVVVSCEGATPSNCLQVYVENEPVEVCMKKLEEGCMGVTTLSGLRILFACRFCQKDGYSSIPYNKQKLRRQRQFVKKYFQRGQQSYYKHKFVIMLSKYFMQTVYPYWLPNTNCYGLTLDTNETISLQCTDREFEPPGCFKIKETNEEEECDICAQVEQEECVVIKTPKGKTVVLGCYNDRWYIYKEFLEKAINEYRNGNYYVPIQNPFGEMYKYEDDCKSQRVEYEIEWLYKYNCWGVITPDLETIVVKCPSDNNKKNTGCFKIYTQNYGYGNKIIPSSYEEGEACMEIINKKCVGITTPKGWNIQLDCFYISSTGAKIISLRSKEPSEMF